MTGKPTCWHEPLVPTCALCFEFLNRQVKELEERLSKQRAAFAESSTDRERALDLQNGEYRKALERIDAMRKRLPDPDFNEQRNTAAGIAEIIQVALADKRIDATVGADCKGCKEKTELLCLAHETISKIAARAEAAELQVRDLTESHNATVVKQSEKIVALELQVERYQKALREIMEFDGPSLQGDPSGGSYKIAKRALKDDTE